MNEAKHQYGTVDPVIVIKNLPGIAYWKNVAGEYLGCNQAFLTLVGLKDEADVS